MIAKFVFEELVEETDATVLKEGTEDYNEYSLSTDTRSIKAGEVYLPLRGENFDGHKFIKDAIKKGAAGIFVDKDFYQDLSDYNNIFVLQVDNTLKALLNMATCYRRGLDAIVIGLTGSSGKTTTKEILYSVLSQKFNVHRSHMNYNNQIGVSKTILEASEETEILIVEMGMRGSGEIEELARHTIPDIGIITNVGTSHIGRLGSRENIAKAKTELLKHLDKLTGQAFLYVEDKMLKETAKKYYKGDTVFFGADNDISVNSCNEDGMTFTYKNEDYEILIPGKHNVINSAVAIDVAKAFEMSHDDIAKGLKAYEPLFGRWEKQAVYNDSIMINDAYNANPDSMKASIEAVISMYSGKEIVLVLGDMLELGDYEVEMHRIIGEWISTQPVKKVLTVGRLGKIISDNINNNDVEVNNFESSELASQYLNKIAPEHAVILLKGSRGVGLEAVLKV